MNKKQTYKLLGVIGGMGPWSSDHFYERIVLKTKVINDSDHINMVISSIANTPDRTAYLIGKNEENPYDIFMKIASENDDYWFWAMSVLNKTRTIVVENNISEIVEIDGTDDSSLYLTGNFQGNNNIQLKNIFDYYPHIKRILYWDTRWYKYKAFFITKLL